MKKTIQLVVPETWGDVTLKNYLRLQRDLDTYKDDDDAQIDFSIYHLCGIPAENIRDLTGESYAMLKASVLELFNKQQEYPLKRIVKIGGKEYGFEPNLSNMAYGAYVDITKWDTASIDDNWASIMSILYRPIVKKQFDTYLIEPYSGEIDPTPWYEIGMDIHLGAITFFLHLSKELQISTLNYLTQSSVIPHSIKSILAESGKVTHPLLNSPVVTSIK